MEKIFTNGRLLRAVAAVVVAAGLGFVVSGCKTSTTSEQKASGSGASASMYTPRVYFDSDSAYAYVKAQVAMGPRVAGTAQGRECAEYIESELRRHGAEDVVLQDGTVKAWNGDVLPIRNVMGRYNVDAKRRVLLVAHYDTRPWADGDEHIENHDRAIPGANDGASGVGVLLEIARRLGEEKAPVGVDLLFVDAEDYGKEGGFSLNENTWCLGTQYWTEHMPYDKKNLPELGVLFDMVGGMGAKFHREFFSDNYAKGYVDKIWDLADRSGYGDVFVNKPGGAVVDDHVFINRAGIPCVDIIENKSDDTKTFPATWHTLNDNLDYIDRASLKAAGQTVVNLIYDEMN